MASIESITSRANDLKEINDTLYSISERLKYYFNSMSMEDNFAPDALLTYKEGNTLISSMQMTEQGIMSDISDFESNVSSKMSILSNRINARVSKGNVTNALNVESTALTISGNKLIVSGGNFVLDENNNVTVAGNIEATSGKIAGWNITSGGAMLGGTTSKIVCRTFNNSNDIYLSKLSVVDVPGTSDLSYCDLVGAGTTFHVDENTIFLNGFSADNLIMEEKIHCGILVSYGRINVNSQIVSKDCYTKKTGTTWSDRRLKKDIEDISDLEADYMLHKMTPCTFRWKEDDMKSSGFIAQSIDQIQTELGHDYGLVRNTGKYLSLNYDGLIPFLIKVIKRQTEEIDALSE